jgi:hypothetical protein
VYELDFIVVFSYDVAGVCRVDPRDVGACVGLATEAAGGGGLVELGG